MKNNLIEDLPSVSTSDKISDYFRDQIFKASSNREEALITVNNIVGLEDDNSISSNVDSICVIANLINPHVNKIDNHLYSKHQNFIKFLDFIHINQTLIIDKYEQHICDAVSLIFRKIYLTKDERRKYTSALMFLNKHKFIFQCKGFIIPIAFNLKSKAISKARRLMKRNIKLLNNKRKDFNNIYIKGMRP
jgi:hypothetical protein